MAQVRYQVDGLPAGSNAQAWFPPGLVSPAGATNGVIKVYGAPGTEKVPSPRPAGSGTMSDSPDWLPPSAVAPDWFRPDIYFTDITGGSMNPPVPWYPNHSRIPVPLGSAALRGAGVGGTAPVVMGGRKIGGRLSMIWPRTVTRWPNLAGAGRRGARNA